MQIGGEDSVELHRVEFFVVVSEREVDGWMFHRIT